MPQHERGKIISGAGFIATTLTRLFEVRHILCHEFPQDKVYGRREIQGFLRETGRFAAAMVVVLERLIYGEMPDTIEGEIELAKREVEDNEKLMAELYARIDDFSDKKNTRLLLKAQRAWDVFKEAQCSFRAGRFRGGSVSPLIWYSEADLLQRPRIESLRRFLPEED